MFRDIAMAFCFGSGASIAAFMVAYRFSYLLRRLLGEGPLLSGFVPQFELLRKESEEKGACFFRDLFFSFSFFLLLVLAVAEVSLLGVYLWLPISSSFREILYLTLFMLPGALFLCLFGLNAALLQCEKKFFLSGFAPVGFNVIWILAVFIYKDKPSDIAMIGLSSAMIAAFFLQWAVMLPHVVSYLKKRISWKQFMQMSFFSSEVKKMGKPFLLGVIGVGAVQINSALDAIFARFASLEGPAYLWYAIRIEQLPLALFGVALSSALLPPLSRAVSAGDWDRYKELIGFAIRRSFSLIFPATLGIFVLGLSIVNLLYGRGDFSMPDTIQTVLCLWGYGVGLLPSVFVLLLAPACYAQKNYRLPTISALLSVVLNVGLNYVFVFIFGWGALSVALATSVSAFFNFFLLQRVLTKKMGVLFSSCVFRSCMKTAVCSFIAAGMTLLLGYFLVADETIPLFLGEPGLGVSRQFAQQLVQFSLLGAVFVLTFFSYAWMIRAEDILELVRIRKAEIYTAQEKGEP